jgi:hypothetical protein
MMDKGMLEYYGDYALGQPYIHFGVMKIEGRDESQGIE